MVNRPITTSVNHFKDNSKPSATFSDLQMQAGRLTTGVLLHADSSDPDMLYFSGFQSLDPFIAFSVGSKRMAVIPAGEYGRMVQESTLDSILLLEQVRTDAAKRFHLPEGRQPSPVQLILHLAQVYRIANFKVSQRFPAGIARSLQLAGMNLEIAEETGLFPNRVIKSAEEVKAIRQANRASEAGFQLIEKVLKEARIRKGLLIHQGQTLTSERLRQLISHAALDAGALAQHTIVAPGDQAVDNHCVGHGPIRAGELIVVDIFPRRIKDGYWGDMTRTFLKGRASDAQRRLVRTVQKAHRLAIDMIKPGVIAGRVHDAVQAFFEQQGYPTVSNSKQPEGFFHALGHGVGLEIHEEPVMRSKSAWKFRKGMVQAVEPGLYYHGLGGCRIEDVVHLVNGGCEMISRAPSRWEIP